MAHTLYQKDKLFNKKWFEITSEGLNVKTKKLSGSYEVFIKFSDIGLKIIKSKSGTLGLLITTIGLLILSIGLFIDEKMGGKMEKNVYIFYLILSAISFMIFLFTYKRSFYLATYDNKNIIEFLIDKPTKEELSVFIDALKSERKKHLITMYGQFTKLLSYEQQYNNLQWLYNVEALTKQEYEIKLNELNSLFTQSNPITGFQTNQN